MGFNTDKILLQPSAGESVPVANARWGDNLPILVQAKVIQTFENAGYAKSVSRTRDGVAGDYQVLIDIRRFQIATASEPGTAEIDFMVKILDKEGKIVNASSVGTSGVCSTSSWSLAVSPGRSINRTRTSVTYHMEMPSSTAAAMNRLDTRRTPKSASVNRPARA